ncbi:hypothetical protein FGB62_319g04 [Gracilaria domingensis]|nr:hypothetical protein FGB62_319g04 [Gracilaria domingensis]
MKRSEWYIGIEKQPLPHLANYATPHADTVIGYDMKLSTLDFEYKVMKIRHQCNYDVVPFLAMGLCTPVDVYDDRRVSQLAIYREGLSRTRLVEGLHALRAFVDAGDKVSIWVDSVFRRTGKSALQLNPDISEKT